MNVPTDRAPQNCVLTSLNQLGCNSETAPSFLRGLTTSPVATRLSSLPKLPLQDYARARSVSLQSDSAGCIGRNSRNWKIICNIKWLMPSTTTGGAKPPPTGVGENAAGGFSHSHPQGFRARGQRPPSSPIQRRRSRTARHQTAVVFHQSSQPEKETTHG